MKCISENLIMKFDAIQNSSSKSLSVARMYDILVYTEQDLLEDTPLCEEVNNCLC